jgi:hypothetical protein
MYIFEHWNIGSESYVDLNTGDNTLDVIEGRDGQLISFDESEAIELTIVSTTSFSTINSPPSIVFRL